MLVFSLAGTVVSFVMLAMAHSVAMLFLARIVDGLSGGNISTARAYVADITEPKDRARAYGLIGAAFGLGFIFGPALSGMLARVSYTAPIWAAAGITLVATLMAWLWLPETVHRTQAGTGNPFRYLPELLSGRSCVASWRSISSTGSAFAIFQTTFALFAARRFGFDAPKTGYVFAAFGVLGAVIQGGFIRPIVRRLGDKSTFMLGLVFGAFGLLACAMVHSVPLFMLTLVPLAFGIGFGHPTMASLVSLVADGDEQGRVQGAASAVESLGRTIGPVWGNASLQQFGEAAPYMSAAALLLLTLVLAAGFQVTAACRTIGDGALPVKSVRADEAEETAQSVERLNHRGDQRGVAAVARKHLADREFQAADQLFGLLLFLIGHVGGLLRAVRTYQILKSPSRTVS